MRLIKITNVTDVPGPKKLRPEVIDLLTQSLSPGDTLDVPEKFFDHRIQKMADKTGKIHIGDLPAWYIKAKLQPRLGKTLSTEQAQARLVTAPPASEPEGSVKVDVVLEKPLRGKKKE
jgi:hypothetical protein